MCIDVFELYLTAVAVLALFRTLGEAWGQLKKSLADEAEVHLKFSSKVGTSTTYSIIVFEIHML